MAQVTEGTDQQAQRFQFDALVRGLCNSATMKEHLAAELLALHHKQTCAPAALAAIAQSLEQQPFLDKTNTVPRLVFSTDNQVSFKLNRACFQGSSNQVKTH